MYPTHFCPWWTLKPSWKGRLVKIASELLQIYDRCDDKRLCEIVTGDETCISFFEPEGKENNKVWTGENGARPQIARRSRSVKRVLYALFFDARGIVARIPGVRGLKLLHDNAPAHCSAVVQDYLKTRGFETLSHPAYSPDLAPCDFWLNPVIKSTLGDANSKPAQLSVECCFNAQTVYLNVTIKAHWIKRLKKCVEVKGEYFERLD